MYTSYIAALFPLHLTMLNALCVALFHANALLDSQCLAVLAGSVYSVSSTVLV